MEFTQRPGAVLRVQLLHRSKSERCENECLLKRERRVSVTSQLELELTDTPHKRPLCGARTYVMRTKWVINGGNMIARHEVLDGWLSRQSGWY